MKILIAGGTGYIGKRVIAELKRNNHEIFLTARKTSCFDDIRDYLSGVAYYDKRLESIMEEIRGFEPDLFLNLAGNWGRGRSYECVDELLEGNIIFPLHALSAAVSAGVHRVIHTATYWQRYDGKQIDPINIYASMKQGFEDILLGYSIELGLKSMVLTLFDVYGEDDPRAKVFNVVRRMEEHKELAMSPGGQKIFQCYIDDVVRAYISATELIDLQKTPLEWYAVRPEYPIRLRDFIESYIRESGKDIQINWGGRSYMSREIMDPSGYGTILPGWKAEISYEEGIRRCAKYDREQGMTK